MPVWKTVELITEIQSWFLCRRLENPQHPSRMKHFSDVHLAEKPKSEVEEHMAQRRRLQTACNQMDGGG
jgi:hypothetical protein